MHKLIKQQGLLFVNVFLPYKYQNKYESLNLVVDTGAAFTIIDPQFTDYLGYSAKEDSINTSTLDGAAGPSKGYVIKIPRFKCMGFELENFTIACHDMNTKLGIAGLLGMNFLENFRIDLNYNTGEVYSIEKIKQA